MCNSVNMAYHQVDIGHVPEMIYRVKRKRFSNFSLIMFLECARRLCFCQSSFPDVMMCLAGVLCFLASSMISQARFSIGFFQHFAQLVGGSQVLKSRTVTEAVLLIVRSERCAPPAGNS